MAFHPIMRIAGFEGTQKYFREGHANTTILSPPDCKSECMAVTNMHTGVLVHNIIYISTKGAPYNFIHRTVMF